MPVAFASSVVVVVVVVKGVGTVTVEVWTDSAYAVGWRVGTCGDFGWVLGFSSEWPLLLFKDLTDSFDCTLGAALDWTVDGCGGRGKGGVASGDW